MYLPTLCTAGLNLYDFFTWAGTVSNGQGQILEQDGQAFHSWYVSPALVLFTQPEELLCLPNHQKNLQEVDVKREYTRTSLFAAPVPKSLMAQPLSVSDLWFLFLKLTYWYFTILWIPLIPPLDQDDRINPIFLRFPNQFNFDCMKLTRNMNTVASTVFAALQLSVAIQKV